MMRLFLVIVYFLSTRASPIKEDEDGSRILNGDIAKEGQFPFAVSLQRYSSDTYRYHICTFSLITKRTCLGAAHCVVKEDKSVISPEKLCVIHGSHVQNADLPCDKVAKHVPHVKYDPVSTIFDIALLELAEDVALNDRVKTIKLAADTVEILGKSVTALGWGDLVPDGDSPHRMRYTFMDVVSNTMCEEVIHDKLRSDQVCLYKKGHGTCTGDSGGPIVLADTDIQIAVVSYGIESCGELPSVYTDVRKFLDWIKEHAVGELEIVE